MKGFRDLYPEKKRIQNYIFSVWSSVAEKYGFDEIAGPLLEEVSLYKKSGDLPSQMYSFVDKSGRKVALRPELTPTVARMASSRSSVRPMKWFSIANCYRYENPQSGRLREFVQLNLDILGSSSMMADAEMILTVVEIMKNFGLSKKDFFIRLSNRKLFEDLVLSIGIKKKDLTEIGRIIDKKDKISSKDFVSALKKLKLSPKQIKDLGYILKVKLDKIKIESKGLSELNELVGYLKNYGVLDYCKIDLSVVRGLDYYTSTVFEVFDSSKKYRAIAGGGRYDNLIKGCPGIGFGMGDVVLELFLSERKKLDVGSKKVDYYVAPVSSSDYSRAVKIVNKLRSKGNLVEIDLVGRNLGKQFNYANSLNVSKVVIVGSKDKGRVTIRDMKSGKESKVKI